MPIITQPSQVARAIHATRREGGFHVRSNPALTGGFTFGMNVLGIPELNDLLEQSPAKFRKTLDSTVRRTAKKARTRVIRIVSARIPLQRESIKKRVVIKDNGAKFGSGKVEVKIRSDYNPPNATSYPFKVLGGTKSRLERKGKRRKKGERRRKRGPTGRGVSVKWLKGQRAQRFKHAFIIEKNGVQLIAARIHKRRKPQHQLWIFHGQSIGGEVNAAIGHIAPEIKDILNKTFEERLKYYFVVRPSQQARR